MNNRLAITFFLFITFASLASAQVTPLNKSSKAVLMADSEPLPAQCQELFYMAKAVSEAHKVKDYATACSVNQKLIIEAQKCKQYIDQDIQQLISALPAMIKRDCECANQLLRGGVGCS